jgi:hypothetical protein
MEDRTVLSTLIVRNLMLEVLGDDEFCIEHSNGYCFSKTYGAHEDDLFMLTEIMAVEKNLIGNEIQIPRKAWGAGRGNLFENNNTNFNRNEIEKLWESFHLLLNNNVIAPGEYGLTPLLPYFHITQHGKKCIEQRDILPYDIDGYMIKLRMIDNLDEWIEFYMLEALRCYNANCYNASTSMIGLASETLVERAINEFSILLGKERYEYNPKRSLQTNGKTVKEYFDSKISKDDKVSNKYDTFNKVMDGTNNMQEDLKSILDGSARSSFFSFLRLNRNEVSHPSDVKKDETETLLLFISFLKYCEKMTETINKIKQLNQ